MSVTVRKCFSSPPLECDGDPSSGGQPEGMKLSSIRSGTLHNWILSHAIAA